MGGQRGDTAPVLSMPFGEDLIPGQALGGAAQGASHTCAGGWQGLPGKATQEMECKGVSESE